MAIAQSQIMAQIQILCLLLPPPTTTQRKPTVESEKATRGAHYAFEREPRTRSFGRGRLRTLNGRTDELLVPLNDCRRRCCSAKGNHLPLSWRTTLVRPLLAVSVHLFASQPTNQVSFKKEEEEAAACQFTKSSLIQQPLLRRRRASAAFECSSSSRNNNNNSIRCDS